MYSTEARKTLVQCDFDGTITEEDVSFLLLDAFTDGSWWQLLTKYREKKVSVNYFNTKAFGMIKADRQTLVEFAKSGVRIRPGFQQLVAYCRKRGFRFVIVSNGLEFYIDAILRDIDYHDGECPYSTHALRGDFRDIIDNLEYAHPGTRHSILNSYNSIKDMLFEKYPPVKLNKCSICGEPTSQEICKACSFKRQFNC